MRKTILIAAVLALVFCVSAVADVSVEGHSFSDGPYLGARGLGIGIVGGVIAGLSIKNWVSYDNAFQFDVNWDLYQDGVGFGAAYLFHNFEVISADKNKFPLYVGIKGWGVLTNNEGVAAGIQVPLGIAWIPRDMPLDIFLQAEPGISVIPSFSFAPGGGVGIRFWLD